MHLPQAQWRGGVSRYDQQDAAVGGGEAARSFVGRECPRETNQPKIVTVNPTQSWDFQIVQVVHRTNH